MRLGVLYKKYSAILTLILALAFCSCNSKLIENKTQKDEEVSIPNLRFDRSVEQLQTRVFYEDSILVHTAQELVEGIKSNRFIQLVNRHYQLNSALFIDSIKNLKIQSLDSSRISVLNGQSNVISISNSQGIELNNLIIGNSSKPFGKGEVGVVRINHSYEVAIENSGIIGRGSFGLKCFDVVDFQFNNSKITDCSKLIFELEKSKNCIFNNSSFHDNELSISVLGGFTNSTKQVFFNNCDFRKNLPAMTGNPAFNFMDNVNSPEDHIVFTNCSFENNPGYVWYGEKIDLINCEMDSADFLRFN